MVKSLLILKNYIFILPVLIFFQELQAQDFSNLKKLKPFTYSGAVEARGIFYSASGISSRRAPFTYLLTGSPSFQIYNLQVPLSFSFSQSDRSFSQPFNQFGMSPTYKCLTVHAGYRNVSFSPYTLGGHTMLGAGFELNPGKLRVGFMYGRLNRATTIDTASQSLIPFSFTRKGYAARLGYGSSKNFFELSYLSAKDDDQKPENLPSNLDIISPAQNNVLGYSFKFTFFKNLFLESAGAVSLYTNDIHSPISLDGLNNKVLDQARKFFDINGTSEYYTALSGSMGYKVKKFGLKVNYKRIDPDFKTMGAYYFNSDLENWTVSPNAVFLKGKIRINGSIGFQHDNLRKQKMAQNKRLIASSNASFEITKALGVDIIYTNFSDNQKPQTAIFADSLRIVQTTQTIGFMPRYFLTRPETTHIISGTINFSKLNDFNNYFSATAASRNITTNQYFLNYSITFLKKQMTLYANINQTNLKGANLDNSFISFTLGGNTPLLKQKLMAGLNGTFTSANNNLTGDSFIVNASGNLGYAITKKQRLSFNMFLTNNKSSAINFLQSNFTETRAELSYQFKF